MKQGEKNNLGFTLLEITVCISLFLIIIFFTGSMYSLAQDSYKRGSDQGELSQNARVCLDRLSRELRQSVGIITNLPATSTDQFNPPAEEIFFQDGHDITQITYIYYYLDGHNLIRQHRAYYFPAEPATYVPLSSVDEFGNPPSSTILEDRIVGEYFNSLSFWGESGLIHISLELNKNIDSLLVDTSVSSRNW